MCRFREILKYAVAAFFLLGVVSPPVQAQTEELDELFEQLRTSDAAAAEQIESRIWAEWSKSGSASMDLLLERGREALEEEDPETAVEHFSALIDHAPDFAEGYNARAMAFYQQNLYGLALEDIGRTLERNPRHFGAMSGLALILDELGMHEEALDAWRAVAELHPHREGAAEAIDRLSREVEGASL